MTEPIPKIAVLLSITALFVESTFDRIVEKGKIDVLELFNGCAMIDDAAIEFDDENPVNDGVGNDEVGSTVGKLDVVPLLTLLAGILDEVDVLKGWPKPTNPVKPPNGFTGATVGVGVGTISVAFGGAKTFSNCANGFAFVFSLLFSAVVDLWESEYNENFKQKYTIWFY